MFNLWGTYIEKSLCNESSSQFSAIEDLFCKTNYCITSQTDFAGKSETYVLPADWEESSLKLWLDSTTLCTQSTLTTAGTFLSSSSSDSWSPNTIVFSDNSAKQIYINVIWKSIPYNDKIALHLIK